MSLNMKSVYLLCVLFSGVIGPHHHHHELNCFGNNCHGEQYCRIMQHTGGSHGYFGVCADHHDCSRFCGVPSTNHSCCCQDQSCIDEIRLNVVTSTSNTTVNTINIIPGSSSCHDDEDSSFKCADYVLKFNIFRVDCYNCHDISHCNLTVHRCQPGEECMFRRQDDLVSARCLTTNICEHTKQQDAKHNNVHTTCCSSNNCVQTRLQHYAPTVSNIVGSLSCPVCLDVLTNHCSGNRSCHHDDVCMISHDHNRVQSGCAKVHDCQHRHEAGLKYPSRFTLCCSHTNCTNQAISQAMHVNPITTTATPGGDGCKDVEDATFQCADYINNFDICNQITGIGLKLASSRCQKTCGLCSGGMAHVTTQTHKPIVTTHVNSMSPSSAAPAGLIANVTGGITDVTTQLTKPIVTTQENTTPPPESSTGAPVTGGSVVQITAKTQQPTMAINDNSTAENTTSSVTIVQVGSVVTGSGNLPPCIDSGLSSMCQSYAFHICNAQSGPTKDYAVASCAKTCNFCDEYYALLGANVTAPIMG